MKGFAFALVILQLLQCGQKKEKKEPIYFKNKQEYEEVMIQSHQLFLAKEKDRIEHFIDSVGVEFEKTGTGLRYYIYEKGEGETLSLGDVAVVKYKLNLLDGTAIYAENSEKIQEFTVDLDNVESGLHEGIKYLHVGDKALLIIPAHLGHGITGDQKSIPSQSTLVFDLALIGKK